MLRNIIDIRYTDIFQYFFDTLLLFCFILMRQFWTTDRDREWDRRDFDRRRDGPGEYRDWRCMEVNPFNGRPSYFSDALVCRLMSSYANAFVMGITFVITF
jgi:hypothetical protein